MAGLLDFLQMFQGQMGNPSNPPGMLQVPEDERFAPIGPTGGLLRQMPPQSPMAFAPQGGPQTMPGATPPMAGAMQPAPQMAPQQPPQSGSGGLLGMMGGGSGGLLGRVAQAYGGPERMQNLLLGLGGHESAMQEYVNPNAKRFNQWVKLQELELERQKANKPEIVEIFDEKTGQPRKMERRLDGSLKPIGGVKDEGTKLAFGDIDKLTVEGGKFNSANRFLQTFKPEYAGFTVTGGAAPWAGRMLPTDSVALEALGKATGRSAKDIKESAEFWQDYDRYKNVVRNDLFGTALSRPEQQEFIKADINPGMDPKTIQANLKMQHDILQNAMKNRAASLVSQGYKAEPIARAYGVPLEQLGVAPKGEPMPGQSKPLASGQPPTPPAPGAVIGPSGRWRIPHPTKPNSWLEWQ